MKKIILVVVLFSLLINKIYAQQNSNVSEDNNKITLGVKALVFRGIWDRNAFASGIDVGRKFSNRISLKISASYSRRRYFSPFNSSGLSELQYEDSKVTEHSLDVPIYLKYEILNYNKFLNPFLNFGIDVLFRKRNTVFYNSENIEILTVNKKFSPYGFYVYTSLGNDIGEDFYINIEPFLNLGYRYLDSKSPHSNAIILSFFYGFEIGLNYRF